MKTFSYSLLALALCLSNSVAALATPLPQTQIEQLNSMRATLAKTNADLSELTRQLEKAKAVAATALYVGIPIAIGFGATAALRTMMGPLSDGEFAVAESNGIIIRNLAFSIAAGAGSTYLLQMKASDIEELQARIKLEKDKNRTAMAALADAARP